jgi:hypothetical protein
MTYWKNEKFEDTIEEIRNRKSKEIQYNGHKNKDKWTNNDLQNTTNVFNATFNNISVISLRLMQMYPFDIFKRFILHFSMETTIKRQI